MVLLTLMTSAVQLVVTVAPTQVNFK